MNMNAVTVSEDREHLTSDTEVATGDMTYTVRCCGGNDYQAHGLIYKGRSADIALACRDSHRNCVPRIDSGVAYMFTTVVTRTEVTARFMSGQELSITHHGRKTRAYVDISDMNLGEHPAYTAKGDDPENDAAWRAFNRLELNAMKLKLSRVRVVMEMFFGQAPGDKFSFSRKAGCSCPCSPGFIMTGQLKAMKNTYMNSPVEICVK